MRLPVSYCLIQEEKLSFQSFSVCKASPGHLECQQRSHLMPGFGWSVVCRHHEEGKEQKAKTWVIQMLKCPVTSGISHMLLHLLLPPVALLNEGLATVLRSPLCENWLKENSSSLKNLNPITGNIKEHDHLFLAFVVSGIFWAFPSWKFFSENCHWGKIKFHSELLQLGETPRKGKYCQTGKYCTTWAKLDCTQNRSKGGILATRAIPAIYQWGKVMLFPLSKS